MENPLELPAPSDVLEQVQTYARDLAYGVVTGKWGTKFFTTPIVNGTTWKADTQIIGGQKDPFIQYLQQKWEKNPPSPDLMLTLEFLTIYERANHQTNYLLTSKAFDLLKAPATPPSVFISYKQTESSDLALLIEARLKLVDNNINIFIDKLLQPGDDWEKRLEETVRNSRYFVCLVTSNSLISKTIKDEIQWAYEANCTMIAVCHNGYDIDDQYPSQLRGKQAIIIRHKNAKEYESAIRDLLNSMNYSTI